MDLDDFRAILSDSGLDVWAFIDAAIGVASSDYARELKDRRDAIVERLYASSASSSSSVCRNCVVNDNNNNNNNHIQQQSNSRLETTIKVVSASPLTPQSVHRDNEDNDDDDQDLDLYGGLFDDDEQTKILSIKQQLEDPDQSDDSVVELLQSLADMNLTFKTLKESDIGRHVNRLRKHPFVEVRRLVKQLVRKWKDLVDEWVRLNQPELASSTIIADGDSPQQNLASRNLQNGLHQVPDFAYSPNPHNGSSGSDRNNSEPEQKPKVIPRREAPPPARPPQSFPQSASAPPPNRHKETRLDDERLASARRRLHENYQEAQNAKKQRTIQMMDIHEIPKPKNGFIAKNKGGFQGRHHR